MAPAIAEIHATPSREQFQGAFDKKAKVTPHSSIEQLYMRKMNVIWRRIVLFCVSGAGAGYFPWFPGTVGTLIAVPLSMALNRLAAEWLTLAGSIVIVSILCAIWLSTQGADFLKQKDPQMIVIDEIVGFLVGNFLAPMQWTVWLWSFLLFRFFDISKPFPINKLEALPRGAGIVLDDVMAGLYTFVTLRLLLHFGWV